MAEQYKEDRYLEDALKKQKELYDFYKEASKKSPDKFCKDMFKHMHDDMKKHVEEVSSELARHGMERGLGHPLDHEH